MITRPPSGYPADTEHDPRAPWNQEIGEVCSRCGEVEGPADIYRFIKGQWVCDHCTPAQACDYPRREA